jgi:hypothetical protein
MALTLAILPGNNATNVVANQTMNFTAAVTNSGSTSVTLQSLQVAESTESDAQLSQPVFLTPNTPVGVGNPTLLPGATYYYGFLGVFSNPGIGPSPQAPGGAAPSNKGANADAFFTLQLTSQSSDGTVASASMLVPVLSSIAPFPLAQGGALQLSQGFNLINLLTSFA